MHSKNQSREGIDSMDDEEWCYRFGAIHCQYKFRCVWRHLTRFDACRLASARFVINHMIYYKSARFCAIRFSWRLAPNEAPLLECKMIWETRSKSLICSGRQNCCKFTFLRKCFNIFKLSPEMFALKFYSNIDSCIWLCVWRLAPNGAPLLGC